MCDDCNIPEREHVQFTKVFVGGGVWLPPDTHEIYVWDEPPCK
jgi:hypothetical protein